MNGHIDLTFYSAHLRPTEGSVSGKKRLNIPSAQRTLSTGKPW